MAATPAAFVWGLSLSRSPGHPLHRLISFFSRLLIDKRNTDKNSVFVRPADLSSSCIESLLIVIDDMSVAHDILRNQFCLG